VSLNWYVNDALRFTAHYVHTDFTGASTAYVAASHEDALMFRMQATY
jgi:phosphate-selective porin